MTIHRNIKIVVSISRGMNCEQQLSLHIQLNLFKRCIYENYSQQCNVYI